MLFDLFNTVKLSAEQQRFVDEAESGKNILVDACIGSGKTTAIQFLCNQLSEDKNILYLTYNKLLKLDAQSKIKNQNTTVTNYHGFAFTTLKKLGISVGVPEMIIKFNEIKPKLERYDVLIIDEYQDIDEELSIMLENIKDTNPDMQIIAVGDMEQKIYDKTTLNVYAFMQSFLGEHIKLEFTQCFRLSADLASKLGRIWNKSIIGVNDNCKVEEMTIDEVAEFLAQRNPEDILCLGARKGELADTLNYLEENHSDKFNKKTVYASITDDDSEGIAPKPTSAIFTTFDSSKGLERKICVVFDFTESYWSMRIRQPRQSYKILRNIFCVAASRGKERIIFVKNREAILSEETLSKEVQANNKFRPVNISDMFDFKYKEDIERCYSLLKVKLLKNNKFSPLINIKLKDELIDLSPCVGIYQEAVFFKNYNIDKAIDFIVRIDRNLGKSFDERELKESLDKKILLLTSLETKQNRYRTQVDTPFVTEAGKRALIERLGTMFKQDEEVQVKCLIGFSDKESGKLILSAMGIADVVKNKTVYELKFVSELKHEHFLQCACYMVALGLKKGILWNTRNNAKYEIKVPDKTKFLDAVAKAITKGYFTKYYQSKGIK